MYGGGEVVEVKELGKTYLYEVKNVERELPRILKEHPHAENVSIKFSRLLDAFERLVKAWEH